MSYYHSYILPLMWVLVRRMAELKSTPRQLLESELERRQSRGLTLCTTSEHSSLRQFSAWFHCGKIFQRRKYNALGNHWGKLLARERRLQKSQGKPFQWRDSCETKRDKLAWVPSVWFGRRNWFVNRLNHPLCFGGSREEFWGVSWWMTVTSHSETRAPSD